jgi:hypothetical protein
MPRLGPLPSSREDAVENEGCTRADRVSEPPLSIDRPDEGGDQQDRGQNHETKHDHHGSLHVGVGCAVVMVGNRPVLVVEVRWKFTYSFTYTGTVCALSTYRTNKNWYTTHVSLACVASRHTCRAVCIPWVPARRQCSILVITAIAETGVQRCDRVGAVRGPEQHAHVEQHAERGQGRTLRAKGGR